MFCRKELFSLLREKREQNHSVQREHLIAHLIKFYYIEDKETLILELKKNDRRLCSEFSSRLDKCRRHEERFFKQIALWLVAQEELVSWRAETLSTSVP
ncbi:hypothetical protein Zmor_026920 [Zophobas morio]|uniref:Uncharacterized protein n=1 Tax=Zophobas morio TaxID=2755281 RepID=A0AA38HW55_9CUCU|nr:hypothetical protein Zmor_026920 [Zophobas morio]